MSKFKVVTKAEFDQWIAEYPSALDRSVVQICEPAMIHYRDETLPTKGERGSIEYFFDKVVAKISCDWMGPQGQIDKGDTHQFWKYFVKDGE